MCSRENVAVVRGNKAVNMIYQLTNRVPALIEQSHLERNEGLQVCSHGTTSANLTSMDNILVPNIPSSSHSVLESMSRDKTTSILLPATLSSLTRACVCRSSRLDGNLWRSSIPFDHAASKAGGLPVRSGRHG